MQERELEYFKGYIEALNKDKDGKTLLLMKHNHTFFLTEENRKKLEKEKDGYRLYYHRYDRNRIRKSYEPFLEIIREYFQEKEASESEIQEFLEMADVYLPHRQIFLSYYQKGECFRDEEVILGEVEYESRLLRESVLRMVLAIADTQPIFLILDEINQAGNSAFDLIDQLLCVKQSKMKIFAIVNEAGENLSFAKERLFEFIRMCDEKEWTMHCFFCTQPQVEKNVPDVDLFSEDIEDNIRILKNMVYMFELEQARYYLNQIVDQMELENIKLDSAILGEVIRNYCQISLLSKDYSYCLVLCDLLDQIQMSDPKDMLRLKADSDFFKTIAYLYSGNTLQMQENLKKCFEAAEQLQDEFFDATGRGSKAGIRSVPNLLY